MMEQNLRFYGQRLSGGEEKRNKSFYWSVYELNNGECFVQQKIDYWEGEKLLKTYFQYSRTIILFEK